MCYVTKSFSTIRYKRKGCETAELYFCISQMEIVFYNNNIYLLQLGCNPVAVVMLHVYKTWNWLLLNLSREGYVRSM